MRSLEIHVFETDADLDSGLLSGLLTVDDLDDVECVACLDEVGHVNGGFFSYVIVLDDIDQWFLCVPCAATVLDSTGTSGITSDSDFYLLDADDEEFDNFDLCGND